MSYYNNLQITIKKFPDIAYYLQDHGQVSKLYLMIINIDTIISKSQNMDACIIADIIMYGTDTQFHKLIS